MAIASANVIKGKYYELLKGVSLEPGINREYVYLGKSYGRNSLLLGWDPKLALNAAQVIHKSSPEVSEEAIRYELQNSIVSLFEARYVSEDASPELDAPIVMSLLDSLEPEQVDSEIQRLLTTVMSIVKDWTAFIFIEGLELSIPELQLADAILYPSTSGPLWTLLQEIPITAWRETISELVSEANEQCHTYLAVGVHGDKNHASSEALRLSQKVVAILTLYMVTTNHRQRLFRDIGVLGYPREDRCKLIVICTPPFSTVTDQRYWAINEQADSLHYHSIEAETLEYWQSLGLEVVMDCCKAKDNSQNPASTRINNSITWYCRAMNAITMDEQYVAMVTALESLLVADEEVSITQRLADSVSMLFW